MRLFAQSSRFRFALPTKIWAPLLAAVALLLVGQDVQAQTPTVNPINALMVKDDGSFHYVITGLKPTTILGVQVLAGSGTDLGGTIEGVVVIPTGTPGKFVYLIGGTSAGGPQGSTGTFCVQPDGTITWENTTGCKGVAVLF